MFHPQRRKEMYFLFLDSCLVNIHDFYTSTYFQGVGITDFSHPTEQTLIGVAGRLHEIAGSSIHFLTVYLC